MDTLGRMTRVWLSSWEWACCGDPFAVGDDVDFGIESRSPSAELAEWFGAELIKTVEAIESHHEQEFSDRVRGRVVAVHAVTHEMVQQRVLRRPGNGAPLDATMPHDGEEWPEVKREIGEGVFIGTRPSRFMTVRSPVPDSARLVPVQGVRPQDDDDEDDDGRPETAGRASDPVADRPAELRTRSLAGWVVDVDDSNRRG